MSVSQGTKNLKFMQRAAARAGPSTATATEPTRKLLPGEASSQWTLPVTASHVGAKGKGKAAMNITYEHSFMPFLFDDDRENAEAGPSKQTGRVQFGKKEEEVKVSQKIRATGGIQAADPLHIPNSRPSSKILLMTRQHYQAKKANNDSVSANLKKSFPLFNLLKPTPAAF
jgi:hypothetical protein